MRDPQRLAHRRTLLIAVGALAIVAVIGTVAVLIVRGGSSDIDAGPSEVGRSATVARSDQPALSSAATSASRLLPGSSPDDSILVGGETNHLEFARQVAEALFAYDSSTDFEQRNADLMRAAAPAPYGNAGELRSDLQRYSPTGAALESIRATDTIVTFEVSEVSVSAWAASRLDAIGARSGTYGIDVTGAQTITDAGAESTTVPVVLGLTVACPPAATMCGLDRVYPQHLEQALGDR